MLSVPDKTEIIRLAAALHLGGRSIYRWTGTNRRTIAKMLKENTMSHSNTRWGYLYQHEDTFAFMKSNVHFFRYLHGIPQKRWFVII